MDRKELLLKLCRELTERVETLYGECETVLKQAVGIAPWAGRDIEGILFLIIDAGFKALEESRVKELSQRVREIAEEVMQEKEEEKERREGKGEDKKTLLLRLCKELTETVEYFYHEEDAGLKAHLGEVLGRYGSLLSNIGWAITWANEEVQDKVFKVIEDGFKRRHLLKCRLEEWLSWKVREIVDEALEDKEEGKETQQTQTPPTEGELPF